MREMARRSEKDRRDLFRAAAQKMRVHEAIVEKDFWVCWMLDYLFQDCQWKDQLAFKGGTSLSKAFGAIERFSEDIDLILDWWLLGYSSDLHLALVRDAYERATGNTWNGSDSSTYADNGLEKVPIEKIVSVLNAVSRRTPAKINSFRYFLKEIVAVPDPSNRAWQKKQLEEIVRRFRDNAVGSADYSPGDFVEDIKRACAREAIPFDNDLFSEIAE